jgi:hypothetical protein
MIELLKNRTLELSEVELDQPLSLNDRGDVARLADLVAQSCPEPARTAFALKSRQTSRVRPIAEVPEVDFARVALEILNAAGTSGRLVIGGRGYSAQELVAEVQANSVVGRQYVAMMREHARFLEQATLRGRIKPSRSR